VRRLLSVRWLNRWLSELSEEEGEENVEKTGFGPPGYEKLKENEEKGGLTQCFEN